MNYSYLLIDLLSVSVPFVFSFHPRIRFYKEYPYFLPANLTVALVFVAWDSWFTNMGVWGFNSDYLAGRYLFRLPVEEVLFFMCIPYACVFTYHCFSKLQRWAPGARMQKGVSAVLATGLAFCAAAAGGGLYTVITFLLLSVSLLLFQFVWRVQWLGRFYLSYAVLLIPFFAVNGILTGLGLDAPIVWYNETEILGIRLFTIPVEDVFYGMLLIAWNVAVMEFLKKKRDISTGRPAGHS